METKKYDHFLLVTRNEELKAKPVYKKDWDWISFQLLEMDISENDGCIELYIKLDEDIPEWCHYEPGEEVEVPYDKRQVFFYGRHVYEDNGFTNSEIDYFWDVADGYEDKVYRNSGPSNLYEYMEQDTDKVRAAMTYFMDTYNDDICFDSEMDKWSFVEFLQIVADAANHLLAVYSEQEEDENELIEL